MYFWLLCCAVLFLGAQGYGWISHQAWFTTPAISLPWTILSGIGLALVSNRFPLVFSSSHTAEKSVPVSPSLQVHTIEQAHRAMEDAIALNSMPPCPRKESISFEIPKN